MWVFLSTIPLKMLLSTFSQIPIMPKGNLAPCFTPFPSSFHIFPLKNILYLTSRKFQSPGFSRISFAFLSQTPLQYSHLLVKLQWWSATGNITVPFFFLIYSSYMIPWLQRSLVRALTNCSIHLSFGCIHCVWHCNLDHCDLKVRTLHFPHPATCALIHFYSSENLVYLEVLKA